MWLSSVDIYIKGALSGGGGRGGGERAADICFSLVTNLTETGR
jgi:hypothetical protein